MGWWTSANKRKQTPINGGKRYGRPSRLSMQRVAPFDAEARSRSYRSSAISYPKIIARFLVYARNCRLISSSLGPTQAQSEATRARRDFRFPTCPGEFACEAVQVGRSAPNMGRNTLYSESRAAAKRRRSPTLLGSRSLARKLLQSSGARILRHAQESCSGRRKILPPSARAVSRSLK